MEELLKSIGKINFYHLNIDEILQGRELDVFKHEWDRVAFEIELMKDLNGFGPEKEKISKQVKEKASMRIYESSGDSDLADCIFADFGVLCDGFQLGYKDAWYTKLWNSYEASIIPTGEL